MQQIRRIVVGLDSTQSGALTEGARRALEQARWIAQRAEGHVTLVHSMRADEHWDPVDENFVAHPARDASADVEAARDSLVGDGIDVELALADERAWLAIVRQALRETADLVIVGKRAELQHDGRRLGSVSQNVMRKSPCAVWVVKPGTQPAPSTLVAATDLTAVGTRVVGFAAMLADACGGTLHVVHAVALPLSVQLEGNEEETRYLEEARSSVRAQIERELAEFSLAAKAEVHVGLTSPTRAILECEARLSPDLVVMGTISRGGVAGLVVGNTAERLIARLDCSILAVKPADFVCPVALD